MSLQVFALLLGVGSLVGGFTLLARGRYITMTMWFASALLFFTAVMVIE